MTSAQNSQSRTATPTRSRRPTVRIPSSALAVMVLVGLAACGGGTEAADLDSTTSAAADSVVTTHASTTTSAPPTTLVPAVTSDPVATDAPVVAEMTPELAAFSEANGALVADWSTQLNTFGDEAFEHIEDVSQAPGAASAAELSEEMVTAIGPDTTDDGLVTLRTFADDMSTAISYSVDGEQDSALSALLGLQAQSDALTAVLDLFDA